MFKSLSFQNFKSWKDTGEIKLAPITGFFGSNSSGKSSILQFLLMQKQTIESSDRQQILNTGGDDRNYVDLGTLSDISYQHKIPNIISFNLEWNFAQYRSIEVDIRPADKMSKIDWNDLSFHSEIQLENNSIFVKNFRYKTLDHNDIELALTHKADTVPLKYEFTSRKIYVNRDLLLLPLPIKYYAYPSEVNWSLPLASALILDYEKAFQNTYYLGPLRDYPKRIYSWSGEQPQDVGRRGELAIPALLASQKLPQIQYGEQLVTIEERIAIWLKDLGLIDSFSIQPIAINRREYEVKVKRCPNASEVLITDVGFGVSQVLPVLVLCYYVPAGSTIILEQPEIHLHPSVQVGLADVFIDVAKTRNIQIILESHSEHLLRRLQRRIAEEKDGLTAQDFMLYFCSSNPDGSSKLTTLDIDSFGNITNWPENFFGDEMGDLLAMTEAAMKRQMISQ